MNLVPVVRVHGRVSLQLSIFGRRLQWNGAASSLFALSKWSIVLISFCIFFSISRISLACSCIASSIKLCFVTFSCQQKTISTCFDSVKNMEIKEEYNYLYTPSMSGFFPFFLIRFPTSFSKACASSRSRSSISLRILWCFLSSNSVASLFCSASSVFFWSFSLFVSSSRSFIYFFEKRQGLELWNRG